MSQLVGILNITPDSFSDGNLFLDSDLALRQADKLFADGAYLIDIGAESTRPGATALSSEIEWQRLEKVLPILMSKYPGRISLDTYHPETVEKALNYGDFILNDVTGMSNPRMIEIVLKYMPICIICHLPSNNVQTAHRGKPIDDINTIKNDLIARATMLESRGVKRSNIILDPGIGFGKTPELNQKLLRFAEHVPDYKVMIGYSRKRFLGEKRMELGPNLRAGKIAITSGASYLRVHDVIGHKQLLY